MSRREKRIQALRGQFPTLTDEELRKKERTDFHKHGGGDKLPRRSRSSPKKRQVAKH